MNLTTEQIIGAFDYAMAHEVNPKIRRSFTKFATARDQLIKEFASKTGLPENVFTDHLALKLARELGVI